MEHIEALIDFEENEVCGGVHCHKSEQAKGEVNSNQMMVKTMECIVAKLENMSTRLDGHEDSLVRIGPTKGRGISPAVLSNVQLQSQNPVASCSVTQAPILTSTPMKRTVDVKIKPSDIKILELEALQHLDSAARLQMFFESVERCTSNSNARLDVAKSRVDGDLAVMIHTAQRQGEIVEWDDCKEYLTREFGVEMNFDHAWRQSDSFHYDWSESPQSFVHKFKCHYTVIQGAFYNKTLPD